MNKKTAKEIVRSYKIKCVLTWILYIAGLAALIFVMTKNTLIGIVGIIILASTARKVFSHLLEKEVENVIFVDLDPVKFNEILQLGMFKQSIRHKVLGAMGVGDYDRVLCLVEESEKKGASTVEKCNNLYRRGAIYFEQHDYENLANIVKEFNNLKKSREKEQYVFNNFTAFDKFDAMADEDYQYVIDVCDIDLKEINPKLQNHRLTRLNVSFYRAVAFYDSGRYEEAKGAFEEIIEFAPKMHKAELSRRYLEKIEKI